MLEAEATADMLLTSQTFGTPVLAPSETVEEPVAAVLVRTVLAGDRDTFARLYEMYSPMVHGVLLARVPRDEVDDLVQDLVTEESRTAPAENRAGAQ